MGPWAGEIARVLNGLIKAVKSDGWVLAPLRPQQGFPEYRRLALSYKVRGFRERQLALGKGSGEHFFNLDFFGVLGHG